MVRLPNHSNARQDDSSLACPLPSCVPPVSYDPVAAFPFSERWPDMEDAELLETNDVIANHPVSCT